MLWTDSIKWDMEVTMEVKMEFVANREIQQLENFASNLRRTWVFDQNLSFQTPP
jgi:hypothetical protein